MGITDEQTGDGQAGRRPRRPEGASAALLDAIATATHDRVRPRGATRGRGARSSERARGGRHRTCGERPVGLFVVEVDRVEPVAGGAPTTITEVVPALAGRLADTVRDRDLVFRLDDAVAVLCPGVDDHDTAHAIAARLREAGDGTVGHGRGLVRISTRVGGALLRGGHLPVDPSTLVRQAFAALDELHDGHGRDVLLHDVGPAPEGPAVDLPSDLRRAIGTDQLRLVWHPLVGGEGDDPHLEALLRWHHPGLGALSPGQFIPLAELHGQIVPLGDWALREACERAAGELVPAGAGAVSVNVSPRQLVDPWPDRVAAVLAATDLDPTRLVVELTETVAVRDVADAAPVAREGPAARRQRRHRRLRDGAVLAVAAVRPARRRGQAGPQLRRPGPPRRALPDPRRRADGHLPRPRHPRRGRGRGDEGPARRPPPARRRPDPGLRVDRAPRGP